MCFFVQLLFDFQHWKMHSVKLRWLTGILLFLLHRHNRELPHQHNLFWKSEFPVYFYCKDSSLPKNHGQQSTYWFLEFILLSHVPFLLIVNAVISGFLLLEAIFNVKIDNLFPFLHNQALQLLPSIFSMRWTKPNYLGAFSVFHAVSCHVFLTCFGQLKTTVPTWKRSLPLFSLRNCSDDLFFTVPLFLSAWLQALHINLIILPYHRVLVLVLVRFKFLPTLSILCLFIINGKFWRLKSS